LLISSCGEPPMHGRLRKKVALKIDVWYHFGVDLI
jgi:hypothetical protein